MHLAADYVHPTPRGGRCRIRIYLPAEPERDAPVVICTELPSNEGQSITNAVEQLGAEVIRGPGHDDPDADERTERLQEEIAALQRRQDTGEIDPDLDPAALLLIAMSAANALTVYPHITRGIFQTTNAHNPDLVHHYANQLAQVVTKLRTHARPTETPQA